MNVYWTTGIMFMMACITGVSLVIAASAYYEYTAVTEAYNATYSTRYPRVITVTSVDLPNRTITGESVDTGRRLAGPITFHVTEDTRLEKRVPTYEDGVLVGLSRPVPAQPSDLKPGSIVFARLMIEEDRSISAYYLLLDDPLSISI